MSNEPRLVYSTDPEPEPKAGKKEQAPPPVKTGQAVIVALERKGRGGKSVTIISNIGGNPQHKEQLLKQLKNKLGTGGTWAGDLIEIQGDQRDKVIVLLTALGYKPKKSGG